MVRTGSRVSLKPQPRLRSNLLCLSRRLRRRLRLLRFITKLGTGTGTVKGTAIREICPGSIWLLGVRLIKAVRSFQFPNFLLACVCQCGIRIKIIWMAKRKKLMVVDTKHVPCKFFRQGACQAGPACPFLHSTDAAIDYAPCKYFTKVLYLACFVGFGC